MTAVSPSEKSFPPVSHLHEQYEQPPPYVQHQPATHAQYSQQVHQQYGGQGHVPYAQPFSQQGQVHYTNYPGQHGLNGLVPGQYPNVTIVTRSGTHRRGGNCPNCGVGIVKREFTDFGLVLGIIAFPIGILCCMMMANHRCSHCKALFQTPPA